MRLFTVGVSVAAIFSLAAPQDADAQSFKNILRDAVRKAQQQRNGRRPSPPESGDRYSPVERGRPKSGKYEDDYATVSQNECRSIEVHFKPAVRHTLIGSDYASPDSYLAAVSTLLPRSFGSTANMCESVEIKVYAPDGREVARDRLVGRRGTYDSAAALDARHALAMADLPQSAFEPGNIKKLKDVFHARWMEKMTGEESCGRSAGRDRFAVRNGTPNAYLQCVAPSEAGMVALRDQIERGVTAFAARQPVSYDGLIALKNAASEYNSIFGNYSQSAAGATERELLGTALAPLNARVAGLEQSLHSQIVADVNKAGNTSKVDELFGYDKARAQAYRTELFDPKLVALLPKRPAGQVAFYKRIGQVQKSDRETSQGTSFARWTEPSDVEIGLALFRALRKSGGRMINANVTTVPGALNRLGITAFDSLSNLSMQIYDIRKQRCVRERDGFRCTYNVYAAMLFGGKYGGDAEGVLGMAGVNTRSLFGAQNTALFTPAAGGWRAVDAEAAIARGQAVQINQLNTVVRDVAQAGTNAVSVMTETMKPAGEDADDKRRRERQENAEKSRPKSM